MRWIKFTIWLNSNSIIYFKVLNKYTILTLAYTASCKTINEKKTTILQHAIELNVFFFPIKTSTGSYYTIQSAYNDNFF